MKSKFNLPIRTINNYTYISNYIEHWKYVDCTIDYCRVFDGKLCGMLIVKIFDYNENTF